MTMGVYIPSLGRSSLDEIRRGPLADMDYDLINREEFPLSYVVPEDEYDAYRAALPGHIDVLPCQEKGIARTRLWIGQHARNAGIDKFLMLDDDIRFLVRRSPETWQLRGTEGLEVTWLLERIRSLLDDYGHVGVSPREGNNRFGEGEEPLITENTRTLRALAYRTDDFLSMEHGRVEVMEDFDVNLQLLENGIPNCSIGYWAQGQKMTNAPGGCSTYRSHEVHEASAHRLQELHGQDIVRLRQKNNKTDAGGFGTRTEVTIQWKRAYRAV